MTDSLTEKDALRIATDAAYERGLRAGRIEARAELTALWRTRVADVLAILQAPIPAQRTTS